MTDEPRFTGWLFRARGTCRAGVGLVVVLLTVAPGLARADQAPTSSWRRAIDQAEAALKSVRGDAPAAAAGVAHDLDRLRTEIGGWLAAYPPAQADPAPWLEAGPGPGAGLADLAAEVSRLRAVVTRIAASLDRGGESGAFYLGRIDVAVTAEAGVSATTEIVPAGASVIDARDITAHLRTGLAQVAALAPGVTFTRVGQRNEGTVYVRGFDMRQVPLFIDGIPVYTPYDGYVDLDRVTTDDVAEVRISKGFASVLYGPNALGGAINVVSRRPAGRMEGMGGGSLASGDARHAYVNLGSRLGRWYAQGGGSYLEADTFPLSGAFPAVATQPAGDRLNASRRDGRVSVKVGFVPGANGEYAVSYVGQRGRKGNPPYAGTDPAVRVRYWQWPFWDKDSLYFVSNTGLGSAGYLRGRAFYDTYDNALFSYDDNTYSTQARSSSFKSYYHDVAWGSSIEWGATLAGRQTLRAAGHVKTDAHRDNNSGEPEKRFEGRILSLGIEDTIVVSPRVSVVAGISIDRQTTSLARDYQQARVIDLPRGTTGGVNPQVGFFYSVPSGGAVRLTLARKTRLPSIKDRYSYRLGTAVPNPDLDAEHAVTVETGYQGAIGRGTAFQVSAFYSRIENLIQRFFLQPNLSQNRNIGEARATGLEVELRNRSLERVDLAFGYSYLDRANLSDPAVPLVETPRHKGLFSATVQPFSPLRLMGSLSFESGRRTQNEAGRYLRIDSMVLVNAKATWTVGRRADLEFAVMNLTDEYYWFAEGYPESGRTVQAGVRVRF